MKHDIIKDIFKKFKFFKPLPEDVQALIEAYRNRTLKKILKANNCYSWSRYNSIRLYYFFRSKGWNFSPSISFVIVRFSSLSAISACLAVVFYVGFLYMPWEKTIVNYGIVSAYSGKARLFDASGKSRKVRVLEIVSATDYIQTEALSFVSIQIKNIGVVGVMPNTKVQFSNLLNAQKNIKKRKTAVKLFFGKILSKIMKLKRDSYEVKTPTCVVAVRGTRFSVSYNKNNSVIALKEGKVDITRFTDKKQFDLPEKKTIIIKSEAAKVRNISDLESKELQILNLVPYKRGLKNFDSIKLKTYSEQKNKLLKTYLKSLVKSGTQKLTWADIRRACGGKLHYLKMFSGGRDKPGCLMPSTGEVYKLRTPAGIQSVPKEKVENVFRR